MPRILRPAKRLTPRRALPLLVAADVAREARAHWEHRLTEKQRARLVELVKKSGGRPAGLTEKERAEVKGLVGDLELPALVRSLAGAAAVGRAKRGLVRR